MSLICQYCGRVYADSNIMYHHEHEAGHEMERERIIKELGNYCPYSPPDNGDTIAWRDIITVINAVAAGAEETSGKQKKPDVESTLSGSIPDDGKFFRCQYCWYDFLCKASLDRHHTKTHQGKATHKKQRHKDGTAIITKGVRK